MILRPELPFHKLKRTVRIAHQKSSVSLEAAFWDALKEIAAQEGVPASKLVTRIDADDDHANLSSAIRLYVLDYYMRLAEAQATRKL